MKEGLEFSYMLGWKKVLESGTLRNQEQYPNKSQIKLNKIGNFLNYTRSKYLSTLSVENDRWKKVSNSGTW